MAGAPAAITKNGQDIKGELSIRVDDVRDNIPLFRGGSGGSNPTSTLQLLVRPCSVHRAVELNRAMHSSLPNIHWSNIVRAPPSICFVGEYDDIVYASAIWSAPVARLLNGRGMIELRRFAIANDAPKNTGSRMLSVMRKIIKKEFPGISRLISYQDTEVHKGTIYKAAGWTVASLSHPGSGSALGWSSRPRRASQSGSPKIRWEMDVAGASEGES